MKNKSTKRALFSSVMALILCFSMLVGTTFAWFTDEVKSGVNQIVAGNLDIELYNSLTVGTDKVTEETMLFEEITYWEPGVVAFENLTVANMGTLALQYQLAINFANATENANGDTLAKVLKVGFVEGGIKTTDRTAALNLVKTWLPLESFAQEGKLAAEESHTYGIVIYWQPSVDDNAFNLNNGYEGEPLSIDLGISLYATQLQAEMDSFGPDYDEESAYIIAAGDTANFAGATFNSTVYNYGTVDFIGGEMNTPDAALDNYGTATLDGVNMVAGSPTDYAIRAGEDSVTVLDIDLDAKGGAIGAFGGAQLTINGGNYYLNTTSTSNRYTVYAVGEGTVVTINGGDFSINPNTNNKRAYGYVGAGATLYINGGNFAKASLRSGNTYFMGEGTVIITGGTFGFDPTNWLAAGYKAMKNGSNWVVVPADVDYVVANATQLQDALNAATGETVIAVVADITGNVTAPQNPEVQIVIDGYGHQFNGILTVNGKSARYETAALTIKNFNFVGQTKGEDDAYIKLGGNDSMRYTNNVTVLNCTFSGENMVAVKSYTGGDWNLTIDGCVVNAGMHSLVQVTNVEKGLKIVNCNVYSKNGANLNSTPSLEMSGCTFDVQGYAIRVGVSGNATAEQKIFNVTNCVLKSACAESDDAVIIFRGNATNAKMDLTGTTLTGTPDVLGNTDATVIVR